MTVGLLRPLRIDTTLSQRVFLWSSKTGPEVREDRHDDCSPILPTGLNRGAGALRD